MTTKQLISNIEALSNTLTPKQLIKFLDIVDGITSLVGTAQELKIDKPSNTSDVAQLH